MEIMLTISQLLSELSGKLQDKMAAMALYSGVVDLTTGKIDANINEKNINPRQTASGAFDAIVTGEKVVLLLKLLLSSEVLPLENKKMCEQSLVTFEEQNEKIRLFLKNTFDLLPEHVNITKQKKKWWHNLIKNK